MKYVFFVLIALITYHLSLITPVHAQTPVPFSTGQATTPSVSVKPASPSSSLQTYHQLPTYIPPTSPIYTDLLVNNMFHTFSCLAVGQSVIGQPCLTYQMTKNAQGVLQSVPMLSQTNLSGGALGGIASVIGVMYKNPPVRTADYLASVGQGLGIVKTANAQVVGSGEEVLHPILSLWQVSRNISYILLIIIFLVVGLMVMFRNKLNPQTVISAQAALPGLIIGLIMITFSYFFAGLISDMAFVGTNVVGYYFSAVRGQANNPQNLVEEISNKNVLSIFAPLTKVVDSPKIADALGSIWNDLASPTTNRYNPLDLDPQKVITNLAMFMMTQLVLPFGGMFGGIGQAISAGGALVLTGLFPVQVASLALSFVAMVVLIYAMFRLLLRLINNFITIIFLTISAPFQFLAASLPGRQGMVTSWILNMLANILAFPAVLAVLYFVAFLLAPQSNLDNYCTRPCPFRVASLGTNDGNFSANAEHPPGEPIKITDSESFPLFGGLNLDFINLLLAFGALIALPSIPDIIGKTVGRMGAAGQLIGQEIGSSTSAGQRYAGQFQQGIGGAAGQLGRLSDEAGLYHDPVSGDWRRPRDTAEQMSAGTRPGQVRRITRGRFGF